MKYLFVLVLAACTDARIAKFKQLSSPQVIKCYSGGSLILDAKSTGKVINEVDSDGYSFVDHSTGKLVEVSADCIFMDAQ